MGHYKKETRTQNDQQNGPFGHLCKSLKSSCLFLEGLWGVGRLLLVVTFCTFSSTWITIL